MARNNGKNKQQHVQSDIGASALWQQPDKLQFKNVSLNDTDKQWLHGELPNIWQHISEFLTECSERYLRITLTPDKVSGRWNAIAADLRVDSPTHGVALSCRGANAVVALFGLAYADGFKDGAWDVVANSNSDMFG